MRILAFALPLLLLGLAGCTEPDDGFGTGTGTTTGTGTGTTTPSAATSTGPGASTSSSSTGPAIDPDCTNHPKFGTGNPHVALETTLGTITAEIFVDKVPNTGMNFVKLAEAGTLDDVPFHRIITNFMMQGGDHTLENGRGGEAHPDCANANGDIADEFHPDLRHDRKGVLSMANAGANTGSSQFFITFAATSWLDDKHAVFGQVTGGMDVVDKVNAQAGSQGGTPRTPVDLVSATVTWP